MYYLSSYTFLKLNFSVDKAFDGICACIYPPNGNGSVHTYLLLVSLIFIIDKIFSKNPIIYISNSRHCAFPVHQICPNKSYY